MRFLIFTCFIAISSMQLYAQQQIHKELIDKKFRLLDQPWYYAFYETMSAKQVDESQDANSGILIIFWSVKNKESISQYRHYLSNQDELKKKGILIIGVCVDEDKTAWQYSSNTFQLSNDWNCILDTARIREEIKYRETMLAKGRNYSGTGLTIYEHIEKTSLPLNVLVIQGQIVDATETELTINLNNEQKNSDPSLDETMSWISQKINLYGYKDRSARNINLDGIDYKIGEVESTLYSDELGYTLRVIREEYVSGGYTKSIINVVYFKDVVNFKIDNLENTTSKEKLNESCITLITKGNKVTTNECLIPEKWNTDGKPSCEVIERSFKIRFTINWYGENVLQNRFVKALNKLISFNTSNQPKEAF